MKIKKIKKKKEKQVKKKEIKKEKNQLKDEWWFKNIILFYLYMKILKNIFYEINKILNLNFKQNYIYLFNIFLLLYKIQKIKIL